MSVDYDTVPQSPWERYKPLRDDRTKRQKTFDKYPSNAVISKEKLLANGFFYVGDGHDDKVQCAYCGGVLCGWEPSDDVQTEHRKYFPNCQFVKNLQRSNFCHDLSPDGENDLEEDGVNVCDGTVVKSVKSCMDWNEITKPAYKYPDYAAKCRRLKSFGQWPKSAAIENTDQLAEAGLFYIGTYLCMMFPTLRLINFVFFPNSVY